MPPHTPSSSALSSSDEDVLVKTDMASAKTEQDSGVEPHDHDVLCGRGGNINIHPGNARFREKVESRKRCYIDARFKREKRLIAESIIKDIKRLDPPGRFLTRDNKDGPWYEISDEKARDKTSQALRENAPKIRQQIQHEKDAEAKKEARQRYDSRYDERSGGNQGRDYEPLRYDNIMTSISERFGCPARLDDVQDQYYSPKRRMHERDSHDYDRRDARRRTQYTYDYEPNEYGLPRHPNSRESTPQIEKVYSYRPNEYGLPARRDGSNPNLEQTYSYRPNEYGLPPRHERNLDQRYPYESQPPPSDFDSPNPNYREQHRAWAYRSPQTPLSRYSDSDDYSEHITHSNDLPSPYSYEESRPTKRARDDRDESLLDSFANPWNKPGDNKSHEDVLALMDSLSMEEESDRERFSDDPRTPPPEEDIRAPSPDWMHGCHTQFNDVVKRTLYGDEVTSPLHSIDMDMDTDEYDTSSSTRSLNGATLINVFEESTRSIKGSMMSLGDSFFNSMNINFSTDDL